MVIVTEIAESLSRKQERICQGCKRPFWAWEDRTRTHCYICQAPPPHEVAAILQQIWTDGRPARSGEHGGDPLKGTAPRP